MKSNLMKSGDEMIGKQSRKRGVAVILALIAVSVATVLGLSLASSSDANVATSSNLSKVASARASAASALDLATTMLAKPGSLDQLGGSAGSTLFQNLTIGGATVRAEVVDVETRLAATSDSAAVEIVVHSDLEGTVQVARAVGRTPSADTAVRADLDGSEFAVLASGSMTVETGAHLGVWEKSPLAVLGEPVRFGTTKGSPSGISVSRDASVFGCVELRNAAFPTSGEQAAMAMADKICTIPAEIYVPAAPVPEALGAVALEPTLQLDGLMQRDAACTGDARVPASGSATMRGTHTIDVGGNFFIERGARMFVESPTVIVVRGNAVLDACSVEVARTGSLTMIALGDITLDGAFVGGAQSDPSEGHDPTGAAAFDGGAGRVMLFASGAKRVLVTDGTVLKGQVYGPTARVDVENRSAVYGRVLGKDIYLREGVALFYDPTLDARRGWSNASSGIWTASGTVLSEVRNVKELSDAALMEFAVKTGIEADPASVADAAVTVVQVAATTPALASSIQAVATSDLKSIRALLKQIVAIQVASANAKKLGATDIADGKQPGKSSGKHREGHESKESEDESESAEEDEDSAKFVSIGFDKPRSEDN